MTETKQGLNVCVQADRLYAFIGGIASLADEATLVFTRDKVYVNTQDSSGISMVNAELPSRYFERYVLPNGMNELRIGLNIENLVRLIPKKDAIVELITTPTDKLKLTATGKGATESLEVPIIETPAFIEKEPKIDFSVVFGFNSAEFKDILKRAKQLSQHISITANQKGIVFSARGDSGSMNKGIERGKFQPFSVIGNADITTTFNLEYLSHMVKQADKKTTITVSYKLEDLIKVSYEEHGVSLCYYLAPYMEA